MEERPTKKKELMSEGRLMAGSQTRRRSNTYKVSASRVRLGSVKHSSEDGRFYEREAIEQIYDQLRNILCQSQINKQVQFDGMSNSGSVGCLQEEETALIFGMLKAPVHHCLLMTVFLYGMARFFPVLIVLTLAWASGSIMTAVAADRLFSRWMTQCVSASASAMPTLSFVVSVFVVLATRSSWGTMLFPLLCVPTYQVNNEDPTTFYATILSGSTSAPFPIPQS